MVREKAQTPARRSAGPRDVQHDLHERWPAKLAPTKPLRGHEAMQLEVPQQAQRACGHPASVVCFGHVPCGVICELAREGSGAIMSQSGQLEPLSNP